MNNINRGIIKWQPFNAVANPSDIIKDINIEKKKTTLPILSQDTLQKIEQDILMAYYSNSIIELTYFNNGCFYKIKNKIKKIDSIYKRIYLESTWFFFKQIVDTKIY